MQNIKLALIAVLCATALSAQNTANIMVNPEFIALDNNGVPVASAKLCTYAAGTTSPMATYTDSGGGTPASNPLIMDSAGRALIYGSGNYKFVLQQPGDGSCPGTGAVIWTADNYFVVNQNPTFGTVNATTFHSTATGATNAAYGSAWSILGSGTATFNAVVSNTLFNSAATGTSAAFQTTFTTMQILGNGNALFQQSKDNQQALIGFTAPPSGAGCTSCDTPAAGKALIYYDTSLSALRYNLGGAGWVSFPTITGSNTQVLYNNSGAIGASSHFTFASDVLTLGGGVTTGIIAPIFNSSNTGTNISFQTGGGTSQVYGNGLAAYQYIQLTGFTVAALPACNFTVAPTGTYLRHSVVQDALAPTYLGVVTGGGAATAPVICDGAVWRSY